VFLPTPEATLASLVEGLQRGELLAFTGATVGRMLLGWGLASALGVALGALIGSSAAARAWLAPTLEAIRPLPASAVMPLAMAIFGLSGSMVLAVVAFGAMWPVLLATLHGLAHVHPQLREVVAGAAPAAPCLRLEDRPAQRAA
jgi:sulfonate transport system permease protein